ncbi:unnamed protein product [Thlaspi arvense]|uniref:Translation elongation factor EF1B beta/delta subunit guanine nucleotide exchange domain-containing protein n=1 Tax=Thlaspi arvense TaxID=13288 RepID=A0AAU9RWB1_THLAR|nr:unnamed protein product [Thlaspi arvense]
MLLVFMVDMLCVLCKFRIRLFEDVDTGGYQASKDDITVHAALSKPPSSEYVNVSRWYNHIEALLRICSHPLCVHQIVPFWNAVVFLEKVVVSPLRDLLQLLKRLFATSAVADTNIICLNIVAGPTSYCGKYCSLSGKSSVLMDVKPWDDETDMKKLEEAVRGVQMEGLLWGASKLVPVGYGIKKMQIMLTIVDDLVSVDNLIEGSSHG